MLQHGKCLGKDHGKRDGVEVLYWPLTAKAGGKGCWVVGRLALILALPLGLQLGLEL
jgi:hypothetical protein